MLKSCKTTQARPERTSPKVKHVPQGKAGQAAGIAGSRQKKIAEARALVAYLAVEETGHSAAEVARFVGISRMGVQKAVIRGREFGRHEVSLEQ